MGQQESEHDKDHDDRHRPEVMDGAFWDSMYEQRPALWSGTPNPQLVSEISSLPPGSALDVGCGEGADALWLARAGWTVTAVDISSVALGRARTNAAAEAEGSAAIESAADGINWLQADLTTWTPPAPAFDLVSAQYFQLPNPPRSETLRRLGSAVAREGHLLVVGHHPGDELTPSGNRRHPEVLYSPDNVTALFDPGQWRPVVSEARTRQVSDRQGKPGEVTDTVVLLRKIG
ncbi:class I SAM-dependent methyltransferase [Saxibacter everestensis]|uniref:Class I SAM-dependent methyltransferase n=1 Tax=Saxibacter everestensis TaxID=2909229 RepID=A0ABY8QUR6_9MICO|nr:class I SAM-dependent methyltransferase [Brevibacteriaceae bacterium ZFBP1038]